jgi:septum formation protein
MNLPILFCQPKCLAPGDADAAGVRARSSPPMWMNALEAGLAGAAPDDVALALARPRWRSVRSAGALVLGSDSLVVVEGRRFDKPVARDAAEHLRFFSGKVMELHSGAALARAGAVCGAMARCARLVVRPLDEAFIAQYLDAEWPEVAGCVGVFPCGGAGVNLFETLDGSHFTVLGMPFWRCWGLRGGDHKVLSHDAPLCRGDRRSDHPVQVAAIHKHWLAGLGMDGDYRHAHVTAEGLEALSRHAPSDPNWRGCNVTMPHKQTIMPCSTRWIRWRAVGAVNTVVRGATVG